MAAFRDKLGNEWVLEVGAEMLADLRAAGLDLAKPKDVLAQLDAVAEDPFALGAVLWLLCRAQAEPRGITPEDFPRGFVGATLAAAENALLEAVSDFTHRRRPAAGKATTKRLRAVLEMIDRETAAAIEAEPLPPIPSGSTGSAGNSPASSGSTPAGGPSAA